MTGQSPMRADLKKQLDKQWGAFVAELCRTYEDSYTSLLRTVADPEMLDEVLLVGVQWPVDGSIIVSLGAWMNKEKGQEHEYRNPRAVP